jgi:hypothetical protein
MTPLVLPATDRVHSPQTGWSRAHWEALADHLLDSLVPYFSPGTARGASAAVWSKARPVLWSGAAATRSRLNSCQ